MNDEDKQTLRDALKVLEDTPIISGDKAMEKSIEQSKSCLKVLIMMG